MEDYLETIITILIGLGAFLISGLRKRKPTKEKTNSVLENWFADVTANNDEREINSINQNEEIPEEIETSEDILFEDRENENFEILKQTAMRETTSINDPPGQNLIDQKIFEKKEKEIDNLKEQKKAKKKVKFDGRKAIIYSAIINRKQF